MKTPWTIYILKCADGTLYTGITTDIDSRLAKHEAGQGAKYTRGRGPFEIIYTETVPDRSAASKREVEIKGMSREGKLQVAGCK